MISNEDYLWFVDRALDQMVAIVRELGDDAAGERPALPGANSAYGTLSHCLGVMRSWAGRMVAGREVVRDREAEFNATGPVEELALAVEEAKAQLRLDVAHAVPDAPLHFPLTTDDAQSPFGLRQGAALFHVYEELSQHLGQMEILRDVLRTAATD